MTQTHIDKLRRSAAEDALEDLGRALETIQHRHDRKEQLRSALRHPKTKGINSSLSKLGDWLTIIRSGAARLDEVDPVFRSLDLAETDLKKLTEQIGEAGELANDLIALEVDRVRLLERKERLCANGKSDLRTTKDALRDLHKIWEEAFDLMSGLCLRYEGLDGGLCQIADAIIEEIDWGGKALSVPGRGTSGVLAQIIHLRFPEWTIWALPLTAQELWKLELRHHDPREQSTVILDAMLEEQELKDDKEGTTVAEELRKTASTLWRDVDFQSLLGDVFGTYVMGPAYACACVSLVLDPKGGKEGRSEQRALAMFRVLSFVAEFTPMRLILEKQWREVVPDPGVLKYEIWVDLAFSYLNKASPSAFRLERWKELRDPLVKALGSGGTSELEMDKLQFRYVLNAAWKARLVEFPERCAEVSSACKALAERLIEHRAVARHARQTPLFRP